MMLTVSRNLILIYVFAQFIQTQVMKPRDDIRDLNEDEVFGFQRNVSEAEMWTNQITLLHKWICQNVKKKNVKCFQE